MLVGCLTSQQQASVSQGRICSDKFTCCHTEIEVADQTFYLTQSQYTDTGPTSPSADPITPGAWQGSHWSANFLSHWYDSTLKKSRRKRDSNPGPSALEADALTTRPTRRSQLEEMKDTVEREQIMMMMVMMMMMMITVMVAAVVAKEEVRERDDDDVKVGRGGRRGRGKRGVGGGGEQGIFHYHFLFLLLRFLVRTRGLGKEGKGRWRGGGGGGG